MVSPLRFVAVLLDSYQNWLLGDFFQEADAKTAKQHHFIFQGTADTNPLK